MIHPSMHQLDHVRAQRARDLQNRLGVGTSPASIRVKAR
jgi:hypothetical protein